MRRAQFRAVFLVAIMVVSVVAMGAGFAGSAAAAEAITVDQDGSAEYETIQNAVDNASSGATIEVASGTYNESVTINTEGLTLTSAGSPENTIIVGDGVNIGSQPHAAIHVNDGSGPVRNVTIDGFTVRNPDGKFGIFAGTGSTNSDSDGIGGLAIRDNVVQSIATNSTGGALTGGPAGIGVRADYGTDGNPGIEISGNDISNVQNGDGPEPVGITLKSFTGDAGFGFDSNGDTVTDTSSPPATDTDIVNNTISNINSTAGGYATKGISVSGEFEDVDVINNSLTDIVSPGSTAIGITFSENGGSYSDNQYDIDDDGNGERIGPRDFTVKNNEINVVDASDPRSLNIGGYEDLDGGDTHLVENNSFLGGGVARFDEDQPGFQPGDEDTLSATTNWWGDEAGPDGFGPGSGPGSVSQNVEFTPWLDAPFDNGGDPFAPAENVDSGTVHPTIQDAVNNTAENERILVESGTYDESVSINEENVSVIGQGDDTVINGLVSIGGEESALMNLTVEPEEFVRPRPEESRLPTDERQAILITASNASVYDVSVDVSLDANGGFEEVNAIQVFGGNERITGVQVAGSDITGTAGNYSVAGVVGVSDQGDTKDTIVYNNTIDVDSAGYSFGVVTRASGGDNVDGTPESVVVFNSINATADEYAGVGYGIESTDVAQVDADAQHVKQNTFEDIDTIEHKADNGTLDVTMNEWEDLENVSSVTDGYPDAYQNGGEIAYDPFLTSSPDPNDFTPPRETTDFGHDLVVPADGDAHAVAFPAPVEGTVADVFGDFNGTVYAYDGDEWESGDDVADENIGALDAFAVSVDEGEDDLRIAFEYADDGSEIPSMTTTELDEGWNFVGAPQSGPSDEAFAATTGGDVTTVVNVIPGPDRQTTPYWLSGSDEVTNPGRVSPFKGYWVFVTDDGELGATVPVDPTQSNEADALTRN